MQHCTFRLLQAPSTRKGSVCRGFQLGSRQKQATSSQAWLDRGQNMFQVLLWYSESRFCIISTFSFVYFIPQSLPFGEDKPIKKPQWLTCMPCVLVNINVRYLSFKCDFQNGYLEILNHTVSSRKHFVFIFFFSLYKVRSAVPARALWGRARARSAYGSEMYNEGLLIRGKTSRRARMWEWVIAHS